ncbi:GerAB/ArcD/ProY family transporter [Sporolactobacillus spathodeae]
MMAKANPINDTHKAGPMAVFFLTQTMQIAIEFVFIQQLVTKDSQQDAWIAVLLGGLSTFPVMWLILRLLEKERRYGQADLFSIQRRIFGKLIGSMLNLIVSIYVFLYSVTYLRSLIELLQVEIFPQLSTLVFSVLFCLIVWYIVMGGFRNIVGVSLINFIYLLPLFLSNVFVVPHAHFSNLLPIMEHRPQQIFLSFFMNTHVYVGFEFILFYYPFIKKPEEAKKWAYFSLLTTLYIYLIFIILGIVYYSQGEVQKTIWPTLTFWKSIKFPFFEHVDIIFSIILLWSLIPLVSLCSWVLTRGIKFTFPKIKKKYSLIAILILTIVTAYLIRDGQQVMMLTRLFNIIGFIAIYCYIPLLFLCQWLKNLFTGETA